MKAILFGAESQHLVPEVNKHPEISIVEDRPDVIISYGGDGTLLSAERLWPGVPKVPIKNSRRGIRCLSHPPEEVIRRLADNRLVRTEYLKVACELQRADPAAPPVSVTAMNEINVHMGRINAAVRFKLWIDEEPYADEREIIGDGLVLSTPFGSTAYFNHITRGVFYEGMGIAFKAPSEQTNHLVIPEPSTIRVLITRGPAVLAWDNSTEYFNLEKGDVLVVRKHPQPAILLTWQQMSHPSDEF